MIYGIHHGLAPMAFIGCAFSAFSPSIIIRPGKNIIRIPLKTPLLKNQIFVSLCATFVSFVVKKNHPLYVLANCYSLN